MRRVGLCLLVLAVATSAAAGQEDSPAGARELLVPARRRVPGRPLRGAVIRSRGKFHADHFSVMQTGPETRRQFWDRLDKLIGHVT